LLIGDDKHDLLEIGRNGKFCAKQNSGEENRVILQGEVIKVKVDRGRWYFIKQRPEAVEPAMPIANPEDIRDRNGYRSALSVTRCAQLKRRRLAGNPCRSQTSPR
jgi:hypothetical protein